MAEHGHSTEGPDAGANEASSSKPSLSISLSQKVNLGNYQSADAFVSVRGVTEDTTDEDLERLMGRGKLAWNKLAGALTEEVRRIRMEAE